MARCEWEDPFDDDAVPCERDAAYRVSYRGGDNAEIIIPERKLCRQHTKSAELGIERNYKGRRGTLLVDEL